MLEIFNSLGNYARTVNEVLPQLASSHQLWVYGILFLIIFAESGIILTPFLPGDTLLFAAGSLIARPGSGLSLLMMFFILLAAAILGNTVNYWIGKNYGSTFLSRFVRLAAPQRRLSEFFTKHGTTAIIYARFFPVLRTLAPFFAGSSEMPQQKFMVHSTSGAVIWVGLFLFAGYFLGNFKLISDNFALIIMLLLLLSLVPAVGDTIRKRVVRARLGPGC